jgi:enamine deaminase RidA (YjgF/YER057c/UK114 family)
MKLEVIHPAWFPRPKGYAHAVRARGGQLLFVSGEIGCDSDGKVRARDFAAQFERALGRFVEVVKAGGGDVRDIAQMTIYVTDLRAYRKAQRKLGDVWFRTMGRHYPAMAVVGVDRLVDPAAKVEIQGMAVL